MAPRIAIAVALVLGLSSCASDEEVQSTTAPIVHFSVEEVEDAFDAAEIPLSRQDMGPWEVRVDGKYDVCGELHAADMRLEIAVCRRPEDRVVLIKHLDGDGQFRQFNDPAALVEFLSQGETSDDLTPLLVVDRANLTLTYVGRDTNLVEMIGDALRNLE
jgi:hypothetical protein